MADNEGTKQEQEMNSENDAREEDIIEDTDSDTEDVERTERREGADIESRLRSIEEMQSKILGRIAAISEAQGIAVENGMVVHESGAEPDTSGVDSFVPPSEMDLLI